MAKINLAFDTKEKTLDVSMDGKSVPNVRAVYFSNYYDENKFYAEIISSEENKDEGIRREERLCAEDEKKRKKKKDKKWA